MNLGSFGSVNINTGAIKSSVQSLANNAKSNISSLANPGELNALKSKASDTISSLKNGNIPGINTTEVLNNIQKEVSNGVTSIPGVSDVLNNDIVNDITSNLDSVNQIKEAFVNEK